MLLPKKVKHRKWHKPRRANKGVASRTNKIDFGSFGLVSQTHGWVTSRQIESVRKVLTRYVRRGGKIWIRIFPHLAKTKKPAEVRMGSGKGNPESWVAVVKEGRVMFEIGGVPEEIAREALRLAAYKLPIRCRVITKESE